MIRLTLMFLQDKIGKMDKDKIKNNNNFQNLIIYQFH